MKLEQLYNQFEIEEAVIEVAKKINKDYRNEEIIFIGVLKGGAYFLSDLSRKITVPNKIDYIAISSYGDNSKQGEVKFLLDTRLDVHDKNIIFVEDIVDSGNTINYIKNVFQARKPKSIKICSFLKRENVNADVDYVGIILDTDAWLVGYGLDFKEEHRYYPEIYKIIL